LFEAFPGVGLERHVLEKSWVLVLVFLVWTSPFTTHIRGSAAKTEEICCKKGCSEMIFRFQHIPT
jgi:hypothetical protein